MALRQRYQKDSLVKQRRSDGSRNWILRYRVTLPDGRRVQRQAVVGSTTKYRTESQAQKAADQTRLTINNMSPAAQIPTVGLVTRHFKDVELNDSNTRRSWSTKTNYRDMLNLYILPRWEEERMLDIKTVAVEEWLATLPRKTDSNKPLENATKQRIRNVFSVLFTHAQRYEFVPIGHNPIKLVRQSGKRCPNQQLASAPRSRLNTATVFASVRRLDFGLKWSDIDFEKGTASVTKAVVKGRIGETKTEVSRKLVPLHLFQLDDLKAWRTVAPYPDDDAWVFASHRTKGRKPYYPDMMLKRHIRRTAETLGINKNIGWHTFRRTYASLLTANKEDVKVVQELLRHATPTMTLGLYAQAFSDSAREAQSKIVEMVRRAPLPERPKAQEATVGA